MKILFLLIFSLIEMTQMYSMSFNSALIATTSTSDTEFNVLIDKVFQKESDYHTTEVKGPKQLDYTPKENIIIDKKSIEVQETSVNQNEVQIIKDRKPIEKPVIKNISDKKVGKQETSVNDDITHQTFGRFLKKYVNANGDVDYTGMKSNRTSLDEYISKVSEKPISLSASKNEQLAYWINVYNAYTIKLILDNFPVSKITDLDGGKTWDVKRIKIGDQSYSLNQIENEIIRPRFSEPRIHFAVNCAAASCPPLLNDAFYAETLNAQLESQTKKFINNKSMNSISPNKIVISKIFDWYGVDFGDVKNYLAKFTDIDISNATIAFKEYNWTLNGR